MARARECSFRAMTSLVLICTFHVFIHYTCFWRFLHAWYGVSEVSQGDPAELNPKEKNKEGDESKVAWSDGEIQH